MVGTTISVTVWIIFISIYGEPTTTDFKEISSKERSVFVMYKYLFLLSTKMIGTFLYLIIKI